MRQWSAVFVLFCASFMVLYISQNPTSTPPQITFHSYVSVVFLIMSMVLNYRVLVLSEEPPPTPEEANREESEKLKNAVNPSYD